MLDIKKIKKRIAEIEQILSYGGCGKIIIINGGGIGGPGDSNDVRKDLLDERKLLKILLNILKD